MEAIVVGLLYLGDCQSSLEDIPPAWYCKKCVSFNRAHKYYLLNQQEFQTHNREYWQRWIDENEKLFHIWDAMLDARTRGISSRGYHLQRLRELSEEFKIPIYPTPPAAPFWRFSEI